MLDGNTPGGKRQRSNPDNAVIIEDGANKISNKKRLNPWVKKFYDLPVGALVSLYDPEQGRALKIGTHISAVNRMLEAEGSSKRIRTRTLGEDDVKTMGLPHSKVAIAVEV